MALIRTLTISTTTFENMKEKFYGGPTDSKQIVFGKSFRDGLKNRKSY